MELSPTRRSPAQHRAAKALEAAQTRDISNALFERKQRVNNSMETAIKVLLLISAILTLAKTGINLNIGDILSAVADGLTHVISG